MMDDILETMARFALLAVVVGIPTCTYRSCFSNEAVAEAKAERAAQAEQDAKDAVPRVIREIDGCKVYAFKSQEKWHYFTRCPANTTTDRNYSERHGKATVQKTEQIVTENK